MPAGRPTDYSPEICEKIIELGKGGLSVAQMASEIGVSKDTLYEWVKVHKEFSDSFLIAKTHSQAWWEKKGQLGIDKETKEFNAGLYKVSMTARFPEDYRERVSQEISGPNGGAIKHEVNLSPDEAYKALLNGGT